MSIDELLSQTQARVYKGRSDQVELTTNASVSFLRGNQGRLSTKVELNDLEAPIKAGEQVGTVAAYLGEELLKESPLLAAESVERGSWFTVLIDSIVLFFKKLFSQG